MFHLYNEQVRRMYARIDLRREVRQCNKIEDAFSGYEHPLIIMVYVQLDCVSKPFLVFLLYAGRFLFLNAEKMPDKERGPYPSHRGLIQVRRSWIPDPKPNHTRNPHSILHFDFDFDSSTPFLSPVLQQTDVLTPSLVSIF